MVSQNDSIMTKRAGTVIYTDICERIDSIALDGVKYYIFEINVVHVYPMHSMK